MLVSCSFRYSGLLSTQRACPQALGQIWCIVRRTSNHLRINEIVVPLGGSGFLSHQAPFTVLTMAIPVKGPLCEMKKEAVTMATKTASDSPAQTLVAAGVIKQSGAKQKCET